MRKIETERKNERKKEEKRVEKRGKTSRFHTGREEEWHSFYIVICNPQNGPCDGAPVQ